MKTIWKYILEMRDDLAVEMPVGAELLAVQLQGGAPCLWALVDPSLHKEVRYFRLAGTGHRISADEKLKYVGTFQMHGGTLVFHLFEKL